MADRLTMYALMTLEQAAHAANEQPIARTWGIRLALAHLLEAKIGQSDELMRFWQELADPHLSQGSLYLAGYCRRRTLSGCLDAWYRRADVDRTWQRKVRGQNGPSKIGPEQPRLWTYEAYQKRNPHHETECP